MTLSQADIDSLLGSQPADDVGSLLDKPASGEDIATALQDPTFTPTVDQYKLFEDYNKTKQTDWLQTILSAADTITQTAGQAAKAAVTTGAALNPKNYLEGLAQGTTQLYGLVAQSQNPDSALFKLNNLIGGTGSVESRYDQFIAARQFNKDLDAYAKGDMTIMFPPEQLNPEFVQGVAMVADPTMFLPGIGQLLGVEKVGAKAVGKAAQLAGKGVQAVARPVEMAAGAAERAITGITGVSPEALRGGLATSGVLAATGAAPAVGLIGAVPLAAAGAMDLGRALESAGTQLGRAPTRIGALEAVGAIPEANLRQRVIGTIGRYGGDAALNSALVGTTGSIEGATIGGVLGYLSGGEEGAAAGIGSGGVSGALGSLGARGLQSLTGAQARAARLNDLTTYVDTLPQNKRAAYQSVQERFGTDVASNLMDLETAIRGTRGDIGIELLKQDEFQKQAGVTARGIVPQENAPTPRILINVDAFSRGKGDTPIYTLGHELVHALGVTKQFQGDVTALTERLTGAYIPNPDGTMRLTTEGEYTPAKVEELFNQFVAKLPNEVKAKTITDNPTPADRAAYVGEELVAEQVGRILSAQKPDAFLRGFGTTRQSFTDMLMLQDASRAASRIGQYFERTFGVTPSDSILFPQIKESSPILDASLRQLLRARANINEALQRADFQKSFAINSKNINDPTVAEYAIRGGFATRDADGTVRLLTNGELLDREQRDVRQVKAIVDNLPGARFDIDGNLVGQLSKEQADALNASSVSSQMKERIAAVNQAINEGRSILNEYYPATEKKQDPQSRRWRTRYAGRRMTFRETLFYNLLFSKEGNAYARGIDLTKIRSSLQKHVRDGGVAGLWPDVGAFMGDLAAYLTNRERGENAIPTRQLLGPDKAQFMGDFLNSFEKGGSEFIHAFRLDRFGKMDPGDFRARFGETGYRGMKDRLMPAGNVGDAEAFKSQSGYTVLSKNNKFRLYGPDGTLLGIYDSSQKAEKKLYATQARIQPQERQLQRQQRNEVGQTAEAGGRNRAIGRQEGQGQGGPVRQAGDVRFMPAEEPGESQALRPGQAYTPEERKAISAAKKRSLETARKYPEAKRLEIQTDRNGKPKFEQVLDAEDNPVLDAKGNPIMEVAFTKLSYDLLGSPKLSKNRDRAVIQTADLLEADARKALNNPETSKGIGWYSRMREFLQQQFGASIEVFGQLLGATSARTPVDTNFKQALEALNLLSTGQYDNLLADFSQYANKVYSDAKSGELLRQWQEKNPDKRPSAFKVNDEIRKQINRFEGIPLRANGKKYNANSQKVLHVLYGMWLDQTVGPKTPNFAGNLTGRTLRATIDVWAARNLRRLLYEGARKNWRLLPEQESGVTDLDFFFAQDAYDVVAKRLGMNADDLQALMWFMEKDVWDKNGWTSTVGAEKSSFDKEAGKLALDRFQAGVTTFTTSEKFDSKIQEQERVAIRNSIAKLPGMVSSRVTHSDGLYGDYVEPSFDVEFSVRRNADGTSPNIDAQVSEILRVASEQDRKQNDVFVSKIVDSSHANARPIVEVGFKKAASPEDVQSVTQIFKSNGIDGFTLAKDQRGNVIGIRAQYIPEISARFDTLDHLDPLKNVAFAKKWIQKANTSMAALDAVENVSYKKPGHVSTTVYGIEEYGKTAPQNLSGTSLGDELGRRKRVLESGSISSGPAPDEGMVSGGSRLPAPGGDVPAEIVQAGATPIIRYMPSDTDYLAAVKAGDTAQAQRMVDEAAKAAGKSSVNISRGSSGFREMAKEIDNLPDDAVISVFTATSPKTAEGFLSEGVISEEKSYNLTGSFEPGRGLDRGLYVSDSPLAVEGYGRVILKLKVPKRIISPSTEGVRLGYNTTGLALGNSANGAVISGDISPSLISKWEGDRYDRSPIEISYPAITYDSAGNVIPLSQRFQQASADIRYMPEVGRPELPDYTTKVGDLKATWTPWATWSPLSVERGPNRFGAATNQELASWMSSDEFKRLNEVESNYQKRVQEYNESEIQKDKAAEKESQNRSQKYWQEASKGDPVFVRFGKLPKEGVSYNAKEQKFETGVSVYNGFKVGNTVYLDWSKIDQVSGSFLRERSPNAYLVTGETTGQIGSDGEPLITPKRAVKWTGNIKTILNPPSEGARYMPSLTPDASMPGAYSMSGYRVLPGREKSKLRIYSPSGSLLGIASSIDEAQRMIQRKTR